jgi:general secretion pathway protein G
VKAAKILAVVVLVWFAIIWLAPTRVDRVEPARATAARAQIGSFLVALGAYKQDIGHFPSTAEGLNALRTNPGDPMWNGPYLPQDIPRDPWGTPYIYAYPGQHGPEPDIVSYGADRQPGGEGIYADVVNWSTLQRR